MPLLLNSRPANAESLRREIAALEEEINAAREKRNGIVRAIASRQVKLERLKSQLALVATPGSSLAAAG